MKNRLRVLRAEQNWFAGGTGHAGTFEYVLEPTPRGTRVTFTCDVRPYGWMWLLLPLLIRSNRARYRDQLSTLERPMQQPAG